MSSVCIDSNTTLEYKSLYDQLAYLDGVAEPNQKHENCPICQGNRFQKDAGLIICIDCGMQLEDFICDQPEWRYDEDKSIDRCGLTNNMLLYESSLSTNI